MKSFIFPQTTLIQAGKRFCKKMPSERSIERKNDQTTLHNYGGEAIPLGTGRNPPLRPNRQPRTGRCQAHCERDGFHDTVISSGGNLLAKIGFNIPKAAQGSNC